MASGDARWQPLTDLFSRIRAAWPAGTWTWDERFECALSTVSKTHDPVARAAAATAMPTVWTAPTLTKAPDAVRELVRGTGGLRGDQKMFTADLGVLHAGAFAYCLWWPWGNGANASARISAAGTDSDDDVEALLRSTFKIG